jgi:phospholipid/cholesterol/gamma-HCH transport system substrate-binding protein
MTDRTLRQRVGLFVAGGLAILGGLILFFGHTPQWFSGKVPYVITYPEAPDIIPGTPIRKSGVRIGEVQKVELDPETGEVQVHIRVDRRYLPRQSEEAFVSRGILSGDTSIEFVPRLDESGKPIPRGEVWPPGSVITGTPPITARSLLTPATGVLSNAQQSLERIVAAFEKLERLERLGPKVEAALDEFTLLAREARHLIPELRNAAQRLQNLIGAEGKRPTDTAHLAFPPGTTPADCWAATSTSRTETRGCHPQNPDQRDSGISPGCAAGRGRPAEFDPQTGAGNHQHCQIGA